MIDIKTVVTGVVTACCMLIITGLLNIDNRITAQEHRITAQEVRSESLTHYAEQLNKINETVIRVDTTVSVMKHDIVEIKDKIK